MKKRITFYAALALVAFWALRPDTAQRLTTQAAAQGEAPAARLAVRKLAFAPAKPANASDIGAAIQRIRLLADSANRGLSGVRALSIVEVNHLKRDVNEAQIARARQLGIRQPADPERELAAGRLVELPDSTEYWVLRNLRFSVPYVTPSTRLAVVEIAQRFQHHLDSLGVPRFRLVITSALRTPEKQAQLRRVNSNASRIESAHEFGTTIDISYRRFAAPSDAALFDADSIRTAIDSVLVKTALHRGIELQAILGRVISDMQREGKLMVMMERRQPVYHMTVARPLISPAGRILTSRQSAQRRIPASRSAE